MIKRWGKNVYDVHVPLFLFCLFIFFHAFCPISGRFLQELCPKCCAGATNGTRKDGKWLGGKEVSCRDGGKTGVLHSHLDADGALLGCVEASQLTGQPAEAIARGVVAEDDGKGPEEEHHATCHEVVVNGRDNAAHDDCRAGDADAGHQALNGGETLPLAVNVVECAADGYRDDGYEQNALEHADGVDMDDFTGCNLHQQRRHDRSEDGGGTGHSPPRKPRRHDRDSS